MTAIVDTLPIFVSEPSYFPAAKLLYQPKYKRHCYKMQLGITFMGNIVLWTGPHLGCTADITIWRHTWWAHPFTSLGAAGATAGTAQTRRWACDGRGGHGGGHGGRQRTMVAW